MFWNVQNIRIGPANRSLFVLRRIASPSVVSICVSSYWFVSHRCTFVSIRCTFALGFAACLLRLMYVAIRSTTVALSYWITHVRIGSCKLLLVPILFSSHHSAIYLFSIITVLLRIASCRHRVASYCISLHGINSCLIRVWFALIRK